MASGMFTTMGVTPVPGGGGVLTDISVPDDYDGDGTTDLAVYNDGAWYIRGQSSRYWGDADSIPEILYSESESPFESDHEKIMIIKHDISISAEILKKKVDELILLAKQGDKDQLFSKLKKISTQDW